MHHETFNDDDVVHMMFITPKGDRKCLVFLRKDDEDQKTNKNKKIMYPAKSVKKGDIVVKIYTEHLHTASLATDVMLRYENVHDQLKNIFADFHDPCCPKDIFLYVCGY